MRDRDSAFAILGLRPGAERSEVDQAYKRLIKRHHPDHAGGDSARAAEINQAYTQLRRPAPPPPPHAAVPLPRAQPERSWGAALAGAALLGGLFLLMGYEAAPADPPGAPFLEGTRAAPADGRSVPGDPASRVFDEPLADVLIDQSVNDALRLHGSGDAAMTAEFSRACLARLRNNPNLPRFDACAAYDEAVGILETASGGLDSGSFNPSAVTARQVGAARLLSSDYLSAESRLKRIRSRVHLTLLPRLADAGRNIESAASDVLLARADASSAIVRDALLPPIGNRPIIGSRSQEAARIVQLPRAGPRSAQPPPATKAVQRDSAVTAAPVAPTPAPAAAATPAPAQREIPAWQRPLPNPPAGR